MYLIAGLGNPGIKYKNTRHNAGFLALDSLANKLGITIKKAKFRGLIGESEMFGEKVIFVKPQTFMNLSGECISPLAEYYKIPPEHIIVIYDDVYIELGDVRVRLSGSDGGHNGMKNIIKQLGTNKFPRVRIGIGRLNEGEPIMDFVLESFAKDEKRVLEGIPESVLEGIELIVRENSKRDSGE